MSCINEMQWFASLNPLFNVFWLIFGVDWKFKVPWEYNWRVCRAHSESFILLHTKLPCCPRSLGESLMTARLLTSVETQIKAHVHTKIQISMSQGIFYNDWVKALVSLCRSCHLCLWACACEREREKDRCLISALHCSGRQPHSCSVTAPEAAVWSEIHQAERTQPSVDSASQPAMSHHFGFFIFQACEDRERVWRRGEPKSSAHLGEKGELDGRLRPLYLSLCSLKCFSCVILLVQI